LRTGAHDHEPLYRVVRAGWESPLATWHSQERGGRWNPPGAFEVLYACCSEAVASDVTWDFLFNQGSLELEDLAPSRRPVLIELRWAGERVVDMASAEGVEAAGFPPAYPVGVEHDETQPKGANWHAQMAEGVLCRSASRMRRGFADWTGDHHRWAEMAIFVENARRPQFIKRRENLDWLQRTDG
jgi:RES domain-containing protein